MEFLMENLTAVNCEIFYLKITGRQMMYAVRFSNLNIFVACT